MAYPFAPAMTLGEFLEKAVRLGAVLVDSKTTIVGPDGVRHPLRYLIRHHSTHVGIAEVPDFPDDTMIAPHLFRGWVLQLGLPLVEFGFEMN